MLLYLLQINCFKVNCSHTWERPLLYGPHFFGDAVSFHFSSYTQFPLFQFLWQSIFRDEHELTQQIRKLNIGVKREFFFLQEDRWVQVDCEDPTIQSTIQQDIQDIYNNNPAVFTKKTNELCSLLGKWINFKTI